MTKVFSAHAASVGGSITGLDPSRAHALGIGGDHPFRWNDGDTQVHGYPAFQLSAASAGVFEALIDRVGAVLAGRKAHEALEVTHVRVAVLR